MLTGHKTFVSCSSGDIEFNALLQAIGTAVPPLQRDPLGTLQVTFPHAGLRVTVMCGGFPANFDRTNQSVPDQNIQLTRGLLLGAVVQATDRVASARPRNEMLSPSVQRFVVDEWERYGSPDGKSAAVGGVSEQNRTDYLRSASGGVERESLSLDAIFAASAHERS